MKRGTVGLNLIACGYACEGCGGVEVPLLIPPRGKDQNFEDWMEYTVGPIFLDDHSKRSPECHANPTKMKVHFAIPKDQLPAKKEPN